MRHITLLFSLAVVALVATAGIATAKVPSGPSGLAFYKPPAHLSGKHGSVIWVRKASSRGALKPAAYSDLVLYRSRADNGSTIAVSGSITVPNGKAPEGRLADPHLGARHHRHRGHLRAHAHPHGASRLIREQIA